jgi:hypothetical protein
MEVLKILADFLISLELEPPLVFFCSSQLAMIPCPNGTAAIPLVIGVHFAGTPRNSALPRPEWVLSRAPLQAVLIVVCWSSQHSG